MPAAVFKLIASSSDNREPTLVGVFKTQEAAHSFAQHITGNPLLYYGVRSIGHDQWEQVATILDRSAGVA